jgi:hypothetical protein
MQMPNVPTGKLTRGNLSEKRYVALIALLSRCSWRRANSLR